MILFIFFSNVQTALHNQCQSELTSLENLIDGHSAGPDLVIPVRLVERTAAVRDEFQVRVCMCVGVCMCVYTVPVRYKV